MGRLIGILLLVGIVAFGLSRPSPPAAPSCKSDWTLCSDNADLVNHYDKMLDAKIYCQIEANKLANYGTPVWGPEIGIFSRFKTGNDSPRTGIVRLVDDDVQFSNMFGGMQYSMVSCKYDLANKRVLDVRTGLPE
jgi:hypothetical protein